LFESGILNRQLRTIVQVGARAHGLLNVNVSDFYSMKLPLPSLKEQQAIADTINLADREIEFLQTKAKALREQKKGLMQQLLTGKMRVKIES
jgi:type I restriction enzyme S subunit